MGRIAGVMLGALCASLAVSAIAAPTCAKPVWPREAQRYELEGTTELGFRIAADGHVDEARVLKSSRWPLLDAAAVQGILGCRFEATRPNPGPASLKMQYVWSLPPSAHPRLVADSCAASERFARFEPGDKGVTDSSGILVRLLVNRSGEPFGIKAETDHSEPELVAQAYAYLQSCRFAADEAAGGKRTDTVNGRVIFK
jgi:TonB family protein